MEIHHDTLEKIMGMTCLDLNAKEKELIQEELSKMVVWVKKLLEVDTKGVEPLVTLSGEMNRLRPDRPTSPLSQERALSNAPDTVPPYFAVPGVKS